MVFKTKNKQTKKKRFRLVFNQFSSIFTTRGRIARARFPHSREHCFNRLDPFTVALRRRKTENNLIDEAVCLECRKDSSAFITAF